MRVYYIEQPEEFVLMDAAVLAEMLDQINITRKQINGTLDVIQRKVENALQGKRIAGNALSDLAAAIDSADFIQAGKAISIDSPDVIQENGENVLRVERIDRKAFSDLAAAIKAHQHIIDRHVPDSRECEPKDYSGAINENGERIYGIDLGTTYSAIAFTNESGVPETIPNSEGMETTPSVVYFESEGDPPIVGIEAKNLIGDEDYKSLIDDEDCGDRVIDFVKNHMGEVLCDENNVPLKDENGKEIRWKTKEVCGKKYLPEEISAFILRKLVDDAKSAGHDVKEVVITCPANFSATQREATKQAGLIAGLNVIDIIDEPVAAAIFYGHKNNIEYSTPKDILVYDLGGGTFDVTVLHIEQGNFTVKCTYGDHNLGGKNWDDALVSLIVKKVKKAVGSEVNPLDDEDFFRRVHDIVENLKIRLSGADAAKYRLFYDGKRVEGSVITREEFESATLGLLGKTQRITQLAIDDAAKQGITQFDEFLLVGGSTKMPQVKRMVDAEFSKYCKKISFTVEADEAVAKGAALWASMKEIIYD